MKLRNRRGTFAIITAIIFLSMIGVGAVAVDFSRLWTLRNELQTSADAAALAGAIQFLPPRAPTAAADSARQYATRNTAMGGGVTIDTLEVGVWSPSARTFTPGANPPNSIRVVVANTMTGLFMNAFGVTAPRMKARAIGWAEAPVATTGCIKPWAIPYERLMYALNIQRGINPPNSNANLNRPFDQVADIAALTVMSASSRTFSLKIADNGNGNQQNLVTQTGAGAGNYPGNYQAVRLGKYWDAATQTYASPGPASGGSAYVDNIMGITCHGLSVSDSLQTETGNKVGPTLKAVEDSICKGGVTQNGAGIGDCYNSTGTIGVDVKAAFYACGTGCNGQSTVGVKLLGSFTLTKIYPKGAGGQNPLYDKSEIQGIFKPIQSAGPVGGGSTTLQKPILVR